MVTIRSRNVIKWFMTLCEKAKARFVKKIVVIFTFFSQSVLGMLTQYIIFTFLTKRASTPPHHPFLPDKNEGKRLWRAK